MIFLGLSFLAAVRAQMFLRLNGYVDETVNAPSFDYFQGGSDWPGICSYGHYQSPIDINENPENPDQFQVVSPANSTFRPLVVDISPIPRSDFRIVDSGVFEAYMVYENAMQERTQGYPLLQNLADFHIKTPAEHTLNGVQYPMTMQVVFVFRQPDSVKYITSYMHILFREGREHPLLTSLINNDSTVDVSSLFPASGVIDDYYYYIGSLTFPWPECLEPQAWFVPAYILEAAPWQISYWADQYIGDFSFSGGRGNARVVQPLYDRVIYHVVPS